MSDLAALALAGVLIRHFEGLSLRPQRDTPPHWQIGYGMNTLPDGSPVGPDTPAITQETAEAWLAQRLAALAAETDRALPDAANAQQCAALYSFAWNEGEGHLAGSTLLRLFRAGDVDGAAVQFASWVYAGGQRLQALVDRRAAERDVFLGQPPAWATEPSVN